MPDAPSKVERVLNLLALLLETTQPLTRDRIVRDVPGYPQEVSANRRAFERDKETLRAMGVPITTAPVGDGSEVGYRVRPEEYYLPDLGLTAEETAALRVAVNAVSLGTQAGRGALMKLGGPGGTGSAPIASLPVAPALAPLFQAFRDRAIVTFRHRGAERHVEPWGFASRRGNWYVVGRDADKDAVRAFRADRIDGDVTIGAPGAFEPPAGFRPDDHVEVRPWMLGDAEPFTAEVVVDAGHADAFVAGLGADAAVTHRDATGVTVEVPVTDAGAFIGYVLEFLDHAEIVGPAALRAETVAWLERIGAAT